LKTKDIGESFNRPGPVACFSDEDEDAHNSFDIGSKINK
jgi:hypothetical protein